MGRMSADAKYNVVSFRVTDEEREFLDKQKPLTRTDVLRKALTSLREKGKAK